MRAARQSLAPMIGAITLLVLWEDLVRFYQIPSYVLPAPTAIFSALFDEIAPNAGPVYVYLAKATVQTGKAAFLGFFFAVFIGIISGVLLASVRLLRRGVYPLANLLQMVPIIAIAPLLNIQFGYGIKGVTASATIVALFPVIANTVDGLRSVSPELIELFTVYGAKRTQRWRLLEIPAALPQIFTGLRIAAGLSVIGAVVGELVSGTLKVPPIGAVIAANLRSGKLEIVFSAIICSAVVGFVLFGLVSILGKIFMGKWSDQYQRADQEERPSPLEKKRERLGLLVTYTLLSLFTLAALTVSPQTKPSGPSDGQSGSLKLSSAHPLKVSIQLNWVAEPEFGGIYEAHRRGFDREEGLLFEIQPGGPGTPSAQLIAQDKVDFGVVDGSEIIAMRAKGAPIVGIFASFQNNPRAFITHLEGAPSNLQALWMSQRRVAVEAGSTFMRWLNHKYGRGQLEWVTSSGGLALIKQDPTLAQAVYVFSEPVSLKLDGIETRVFDVSESGFNPYAVVIATNERMIREEPQVVRAMYRALKRGWGTYLKDSATTNHLLNKANPSMSFEAMELATRYAKPYIEGDGDVGHMTLSRWQTLDEQLRILGVLNKSAPSNPENCFWRPEE